MNLSLKRIIKENVAEEAKKNGKMIAFFVPPSAGQKLSAPFKDIDGDFVEPEYQHITIGLLRNDDKDDKKVVRALKRAAKEMGPFKCPIKSFDIFPPHESNDNRYVLHAKPDPTELKKVHEKVFKRMKKRGIEIDNGNFEFNPHITICYAKDKPDISKNVKGNINFGEIYFCKGDDKTPVALK